MPKSIEVARLDQIPPASGARFTLADNGLAVFNTNGTIRHFGVVSFPVKVVNGKIMVSLRPNEKTT